MTGISLLFPGSVLDAMWRIKPAEHQQLLTAGAAAAFGFLALSAAMAATSVGAFLRRRWGWRFALIIFSINGLGDAARIVLGAPIEGAIGVGIVVTVLFWLTRPHVRAMFATRTR
jgi:hypothetical protein